MRRQDVLDAAQAARRLAAARDEIVQRWEQTLREEGVVDQQARSPLRDRLPDFLIHLSREVAGGAAARGGIAAASRAHGALRTQLPNYELSDIFREYAVLRSVVLAVLEADGTQVDGSVRERLLQGIENGLFAACQAFTSIHMRREQLATIRRQQLLEIVSHDLRSPLQNILAAVPLIRNIAGVEAAADRHLAHIATSARAAADLADNLLELAQIESGGLVVEPVAHEVAPLLEAALERHQEEAQSASVRFVLEVSSDIDGPVLVDRDQILRVCDNLLANSLKAIEGGGTITVTAVPSGDDVQVSVADTGIGIAPADLEGIFDRFRQATHGQGAGIGLGLAIAKGIVDAHGGDIRIESTPGAGTQVYLRLPANRRDPQGG